MSVDVADRFMMMAERAYKQRDALATALRRIQSLDEKNVPKYAQQIASEALSALKTAQQKDEQ